MDFISEINPRTLELPNYFQYIDLESVNKGNLVEQKFIFKNKAPSRAQRLLEKNDILFQMVRPYQQNNYYYKGNKIDTVASTGYAQIRSKIEPSYLYQIIHTKPFLNNVLLRCTGSSYPAINSNDFKKIPVFYSINPDEQKKIGSFFEKLDFLIQKQQDLIILLKSYKRGALRKVFDFTDEPFRSATLEKLCHITTGKLDANAMVEKGKYRFYTCAKEHYYINTYAFNTEALLISGNGANVGYIHHYNGKFNAYQRTYVLTNFVGVNPTFLEYYLETYLSERIESEKKAGNTPYIVLSTLSEMNIICPNIENQNTISKLFKHLDLKIKKEEYVLYCLQDLKNSLLQKMFI